MYDEKIATSSVEEHTESQSRLDALLLEFSKLYEKAAETSSRCQIRTKLIQGLSDGLSH